jgi:integrase
MSERESGSATTWSRQKKDDLPRGLFRHRAGGFGIRYVCGSGHVHQEHAGTVKTEAARTYHARRARVRDEPGWCPRAERRQARAAAEREATTRPLTVREYAERWLREHVAMTCKPRTRELYASVFARHIFPALGAVALSDVTRERLRALLAERANAGRPAKYKESTGQREPLARATVANIVIPLRAMLNAAVDDGKIPANPAGRLGRFSRGLTAREARMVTALTADELARVLAVAAKHYPDSADLLHVLAWTGLRLGEGCALQWGDLDAAGRFLEVRRTVSYRGYRVLVGAPKSGHARRVDLPTVLVARLRERQSVREAEAAVSGRRPSPWIFPAPTNDAKPINAAHIRFKVWYRLLRHVGLRGVRLHDLRHTYASLLLQAGEPIGYVKEQLGHSSIQVTVDRYGHFIPGTNRQAVDWLAEATTPAAASRDFDFTSTSGEGEGDGMSNGERTRSESV